MRKRTHTTIAAAIDCDLSRRGVFILNKVLPGMRKGQSADIFGPVVLTLQR